MQIAFVVYPELTALDVVGPYEFLRTLPGAEVRFVWREPGPVVTDSGVLLLAATHSFDESPAPDIVLVPGSLSGTMAAAQDEKLLSWLRRADATSTWTMSVCSGSVILAAAGVLAGRRATSHWAALPMLRAFGVKPHGDERIVRDGKFVTAAGVSAGLDLGLAMVAEIAGRARAEAVQLALEYDPRPPFDAGSATHASAGLKVRAAKLMKEHLPNRRLGGELVSGAKLLWARAIERARGASSRSRAGRAVEASQ